MVDVAGQRSGRKKWIHCFDDVKVRSSSINPRLSIVLVLLLCIQGME